ncbi:MAG: hypothetical protein D3921_16030 [Candidatus Electrothrix sp. AW1]|nr:hypothetical protein [Candidatus Electrothrix sp. AX1]MCI5184000.1 hypothetical protein [Candidatus Electrothrix gigas]
MNTDILKTLQQLHIDFDSLPDNGVQDKIMLLINIVEQLAQENQELKETVRLLKDENNRLKGEQGCPIIRPKTQTGDISSESDRKKKKSTKRSKRKKRNLVVHEEKSCPVDKEKLPADAVPKGHDTVVVQDIIIEVKNTAFNREVYYSASENRRIIGALPIEYQGGFGPGIRTLILCLYNDSNMSQPKIHSLLQTVGVEISPATISRIITDDVTCFHEEKSEIVSAGLQATNYQNVDDTGARVNGANFYNHVLCSPYYTAYFTRAKKNRLTLLEIFSEGELTFQLNSQTIDLLSDFNLSEKQRQRLIPFLSERIMERSEMDALLSRLFPDPSKQKTNRQRILEACAVTAFRHQGCPFPILICDDAPQFKGITEYLGLCWIHEGRHYKKMQPFMENNREKLAKVLSDFWEYYHCLLDYKEAPSKAEAERLSEQFDTLFQQTTGYDALDERLQKTWAKKDNLLLVLQYPHIPLHNNSAELGARAQARKRDVSFQTKNEKGTQAKDTMMTVVETAKKLSVNVFEYIHDRISKKYEMPSLASIISSQSQHTASDPA